MKPKLELGDTLKTTMKKSPLIVLLGTLLISASANIPLNVPLFATEIPGTWQTFMVLVFAYATNRWYGFLAVLLYLIIGGLGLPVFADGSFGWEVLIGNTGGYLFGFAVAAFVVGWFGERENWQTNFGKSLIAMTIGTAIILILGTTFLGVKIGFGDALKYGFYPFLLGAVIKIVLGAAVLPLYNKTVSVLKTDTV
jgi:biotin transport system substrate-specific component